MLKVLLILSTGITALSAATLLDEASNNWPGFKGIVESFHNHSKDNRSNKLQLYTTILGILATRTTDGYSFTLSGDRASTDEEMKVFMGALWRALEIRKQGYHDKSLVMEVGFRNYPNDLISETEEGKEKGIQAVAPNEDKKKLYAHCYYLKIMYDYLTDRFNKGSTWKQQDLDALKQTYGTMTSSNRTVSKDVSNLTGPYLDDVHRIFESMNLRSNAGPIP